MEYTEIGHNSKLKVSKIGMGLWQASDAWNGNDDSIVEAVGESKKMGINLVDTAEGYGNGHSESVLGSALKKFGRENFFVATKVMGAHLGQKELLRAADASIKRLGAGHIDLYQIHWPDPWEQIPFKHTFSSMAELYRQGKIRAVGVSNFAVRDLEEAREILGDVPIVSNQVRYNVLQRNIEEEVLPYCKKHNISIIAWSPLAQGVVSGKYNSTNAPKDDVRNGNQLFAPKNLDASRELIQAMKHIGEKYSKTSAQVALNWLISHEDVIAIPGAKSQKQAKENAEAASFKLTQEELRELNSISSSVEIDYLPE